MKFKPLLPFEQDFITHCHRRRILACQLSPAVVAQSCGLKWGRTLLWWSLLSSPISSQWLLIGLPPPSYPFLQLPCTHPILGLRLGYEICPHHNTFGSDQMLPGLFLNNGFYDFITFQFKAFYYLWMDCARIVLEVIPKRPWVWRNKRLESFKLYNMHF